LEPNMDLLGKLPHLWDSLRRLTADIKQDILSLENLGKSKNIKSY
jgi:hypothetical protein